MNCPKCGAENPDDARLCRNCSWVLSSTTAQPLATEQRTSGLAIAALVLAILTPFTCLLTLIPAIVCGILALVKIEQSAGQLKGKGMAITGIAAPAFIAPVAVFMGLLIPALGRTRQIAHRVVCDTNVSSLGKAMLVYANDYDGKFPTPSNWCDLLIEHADMCEGTFRCKGACDGPCNYAMNANVEKLGADCPADIVLLFETTPGWNQAGGREILSTENHEGKGCNVVFVDTHVEFIRTEYLGDLKWTVEEKEDGSQ